MPSADSAAAPRRSRIAIRNGGGGRERVGPSRSKSRVASEWEQEAVPDEHLKRDATATKSSAEPPQPPMPPPSLFSRRFLSQSLPIKHRNKHHHDRSQRGRSRSRTLVNPLIVGSTDATSTSSSSSIYSAHSNTQGETAARPELPVLRYKYVARNVQVLVGSRWRLQPFQERTLELRTGNAPCLLIYPIASDGEREIIGHDTQILPLDTACQFTSSRASGVTNGLKLSSNQQHRAFRVRVRFATAADAFIWRKLVQDALRHARWSRHLVPAASLSSSFSTMSACSGSGAYSTASSFTPAHSTKVALFVHLATRKEYVVKSFCGGDVDCNEILILKRLWTAASASSRDLVHGYRVVETASEVRVIMPKLPGETLLQFLQKRSKPCVLTELEAQLLIAGLCRQLQAIHAAGIVHCDLKLENILLTNVANPRVIDFGGAFDLMGVTDVVKGDDRSLSRSGLTTSLRSTRAVAMVGTPGYIAPERVLRPNDPPAPRADVFSLGIVLFQILTGQHPFIEATRTHRPLMLRDSLTLDWTKAQTLLIMRGISMEARQLLRKMLEHDPGARIDVGDIINSSWVVHSS